MLQLGRPGRAPFEHELPPEHTAFVYVLSGVALVGADRTAVATRDLAVLGRGAVASARASQEPARFLLLAAAPLGEPIARRGPFVMNTDEELDRAFDDYRAGRLTRRLTLTRA